MVSESQPIACFERGGVLTCVRRAPGAAGDGGEESAAQLAALARAQAFQGRRELAASPEESYGRLEFAWDGDQRGAPLSSSGRAPPDALMRWSNMRPSPVPIGPAQEDLGEMSLVSRRSAEAPTLPRIASMMYAE